MASFTDKIPTFNPYVAQQPVEAMVKVGIAKQQQYDTNVQKIQQSMSNIAGLDIGRDVDKQYLQQKMGDMSKRLRTFAAGDFSSSQLTSSVKGMITGIADDEIVQNSVRSTMAAKQAKQLQSKYTSEGKGSPSNDYMLNRQLEKWYNDPKEGAVFNGSYKPYTDYHKPAMEVIKNLAKDYTENDVVFDYDKNGNISAVRDALTKTVVEGITPDKIQSALKNGLTPAMWEQVTMDGIYQYSGAPDEVFAESTKERYGSILQNNNKKINALKKEAVGSSVEVQEALNRQIEGLEEYGKNVSREFNSINSQLDKGDFDGAKAKMFTIDWMDGMANSFASTSVKRTVHSNPYKDVQLKQADMDQRSREFWAKYKQTEYWNTVDANLEQQKINIDKDKAAAAAAEKDGTGNNGLGAYGGLTLGTTDTKELTPEQYIKQTKEKADADFSTYVKTYKEVITKYGWDDNTYEIQLEKYRNNKASVEPDVAADIQRLETMAMSAKQKRSTTDAIENNANKLYPTEVRKVINPEDNKSFFVDTTDGSQFDFTTDELVEKFKELSFASKRDTKEKQAAFKALSSFEISPTDAPEIVEKKKRDKIIYDAWAKSHYSNLYGKYKYDDAVIYDQSGNEIDIYAMGEHAKKVKYNLTPQLADNEKERNKYVADQLKDHSVVFAEKGYPVALKKAEDREIFVAAVMGPLSDAAKRGNLEGTDVSQDDINEYMQSFKNAYITTDGADRNVVNIVSDKKASTLSIPLSDARFNEIFQGRYQMNPEMKTYFNNYVPQLLNHVEPVTPLIDPDTGRQAIDPETGNPMYDQKQKTFWSTANDGEYGVSEHNAAFKRENGYFGNVGMFNVAANIVTDQQPTTASQVYVKLRIYDKLTNKTYYSTIPTNPGRVDELLKSDMNDLIIWQMLPGNKGKIWSKEELEARTK